MTDTDPQNEVETEDENDEDEELENLLPDLYVEKSTRFLYEVKFFENCVLVRPATPVFYLAIRKLSHHEFTNEFEEFYGDHDQARDFIRNAPPEFVIE